MSRLISINDLVSKGYDVVAPHQMFGRNSSLMSGNPIYEGGYRAVTFDEMFGSGSTIVEPDDVSLLAPSFVDSFVYQLFIAVSLVLYLHMLLRSWGFMGAIWGNMLSVHGERRMANEGGELPLSYFKVVAIIVGIIMCALVGVRYADVLTSADSHLYSSPIYIIAPVVSLLFVLLFAAWLYVLHVVVGWVSQSSNVEVLRSISLINFVRCVVLLFPLVAAWLVAPVEQLHGWSIALICGAAIMLLIYLKDTFVFFIAKKIPILYWILYLCTAFLLPLSFLVVVLQL
ncbi:MAG: DUF4271 domain-containing protein [Alistipes sp.]|nr:DUF4271 domain-containing protein [Alistipes sp.]